jgi:hypothetical protein
MDVGNLTAVADLYNATPSFKLSEPQIAYFIAETLKVVKETEE